MPLAVQDIVRPFVGALDESTEPKLLEDGFTTVENGWYRKTGSISKRRGLVAQVSSGFGTERVGRLASYGDQLLATTDTSSLYAAREADDKWILQDLIPEATIRRLGIRREIDQSMTYVDMAICNGYSVYAWIRADDQDCYYRIVESATGTVVAEGVANVTAAAVSVPRLCQSGTNVLLTYTDGPNNDLYARRIDCSTNPPTVGTETALVTTLNNASLYYDICSRGTGWALFFRDTTPVGVLREVQNANPPTLGWTATLATDATFLSCQAVGANVFIAYMVPAGNMTYRVFNSTTGASVLGATTLEAAPTSAGETSIAGLTSTSALISWKSNTELIKWRTASTAGSVGGPRSTYRVTAESKLFTVTINSNAIEVYQWVLTFADTQSALVLVHLPYGDTDTANMRPVATAAFGVTTPTQRIYLANTSIYGVATEVRCATRVQTASGSSLLGGDELRANFADRRRHQAVRYGTALYLSGGIVTQWDGKQATELAYIQAPKITGSAAAAGGSLPDGSYQMVAVYEEYDDNGDVHRSIPSLINTETVSGGGGNGLITVAVEPLTLTMRQDNAQQQPKVEIAIYITEANLDVFYRLTVIGSGQANDYNRTSAYTAITIATIPTSNPTLYTTGGILENEAIHGGATILCEHKSRLWAAGGEDPEVLWYSQPRVDGEPAEFNLAQTLRVSGHTITGLASLDDILVVFTDRSIFAIHGEGPNSLGDISSGSFSDPIQLPVDMGASNPTSEENHAIAVCPAGVVFPSTKGLSLLDRSRSVRFLGMPVEDSTSSFGGTRTAVVVPELSQVRWHIDNGIDPADTGGRVAVWDYELDRWSIWKYLSGKPATGAVMHKDAYTILAVDKKAYAESSIVYTDDGAWYGVTIETGWMSFAQPFAFKRLRRLGVNINRNAAAGLAVSIARDGGSYVTRTFTEAEITALDQDALRVHCSQQKGNRWRVKLAETAPAVAGQGLGYVGLIFNVGLKGREARVEATASK